MIYAVRERLHDGPRVQAFVAIGEITSRRPHEANGIWSLKARWLSPVQPAAIHDLLDDLDLTRGNVWGARFRQPLLEIGQQDYERIGRAMGQRLADLRA